MINICFHGIGRPGRVLEPDEDKYWISHDMYLRVLDTVAGRSDIMLSFDDGNASDVELGLPALSERGLTASFFVLAGRLGRPGSLSQADLRALGRAGMTIGTHGMDHVPWRHLDEDMARRELVEARDVIAEAVGRPVHEAACPLGRYDRTLLRRMRQLDYIRLYTSDRARARPESWLQPRYSVTAHDTVATIPAQILSPPTLRQRLRSDVARLVKGLR